MSNHHASRSSNLGLEPFSDAVRERAFWVWFGDADRSPKRTADLLAQQERDDAEAEGREAAKTPDLRTISRWANKDNWNNRVQEHLATFSPAIVNELLGRELVLARRRQEWRYNMFSNESNPDTAGIPPMRLADIRERLDRSSDEKLGSGALGKRFNVEINIPLPPGASDGASLTDQERMLRHKAKIEGKPLPEGEKA